MKLLRICGPGLAALMLLTACGAGAGSPDAENPEAPGSDECRVIITSDVTTHTVFTNGPEDCDYYFPGGDVSDSTYRITNELRIEPGTTLRFGPNAMLFVRSAGTLQAVGTAAERITMEGEETSDGYWDGICFQENRESTIAFVDIRSAGNMRSPAGTSCRGGIAGSYPAGEPVHITDTTVSGSYENGLSAHNLILGDFANNAFFGNRQYGVVAPAEQIYRLDTATDYLGSESGAVNGMPYVYAAGHINDAEVDHIWHNLNAPYFVSRDERVNYGDSISASGTTLVIAAGTTMIFDGDSELYVSDGSSLGLGGEPGNPVVLTGLQEERGSWNGLTVSNSAAILQNVDILWAGRSDLFYTGSLYFVEVGTDPNGKILDNVHIDGSASCALVIEHDDRSVFQQLDVTYGDNNENNEC